jgi:uncharacterized protein (DUF362 family)/Pyruvate/2-oxoacid:ferredoxin oxidoreductase delta subunit
VFSAVRRAIDAIGGLKEYIKPGSRVLVKPNLLVAREPEAGITTHPAVVRAVVRLLKEMNCRVFLGDGPSAWANHSDNVPAVYEKTGMKKVAEEEGIELVYFDKRRWRGKFPLTTRLDECDHLVNIPKFKTHELTTLTAAIKNLYGLVSGTYKAELHKKYFAADEFAGILADIYEQARPALTVVDGIVAMEGDGPGSSGKLRDLGLLFAGADCVAIDSILARVMGIDPLDVPSIREAARRGLGTADMQSMEVRGEKLEDVTGKPFILPTASRMRKLPLPVLNAAKQLFRCRPVVNRAACVSCGSCVGACPKKVMSIQKKRVVIDYRGCISCFCCLEVCPAKAIKVKKSLAAKVAGL